MIAYCGLQCNECEVYFAAQRGDIEEMARLAQRFSSDQRTFSADDLWCDGCATTGERLFAWCRECAIRLCAAPRPLSHCGECVEFPCALIEAAPADVRLRLEGLRGNR